MSHPSHFKGNLKIGFIESDKKIFTPAVSLSTEKIEGSEKEYLSAVVKNHKKDLTKYVRKLGLINTQSGNAYLLQIDTKNGWGKIRILQSILIKDHVAYIHTATCLREDFLKHHEQFLACFRSLTITNSLTASLNHNPDFEKKLNHLILSWKKHLSSAKGKKEELFKGTFFQKNQWAPFTEYIVNQYEEQGICWQTLAIQHVKEKLMNM